MDFEWDDAKNSESFRKHRVDFQTGAKVYLDPLVSESDDLSRLSIVSMQSAWRTAVLCT